jgi:hypothetical protein
MLLLGGLPGLGIVLIRQLHPLALARRSLDVGPSTRDVSQGTNRDAVPQGDSPGSPKAGRFLLDTFFVGTLFIPSIVIILSKVAASHQPETQRRAHR